ncbi:hypothetical protein D3C72_1779660 [compost metagenome]
MVAQVPARFHHDAQQKEYLSHRHDAVDVGVKTVRDLGVTQRSGLLFQVVVVIE